MELSDTSSNETLSEVDDGVKIPRHYSFSTDTIIGDRLLSRRSNLSSTTRASALAQASVWQERGRLENADLLSDLRIPLSKGHDGRLLTKSFQHKTTYVSSEDKASTEDETSTKELAYDISEAEDSDDYVDEEIKGLFHYIDEFNPQAVEIGTILKPFVPDYIPAVGTVDEFIKVPRPDGLPDFLGLKVLDESGSNQNDAAILSLQLRASSMQMGSFPLQVASIENPEKNPRRVDAWIESIKDLQRIKPSPTMIYSNPMPDIEKLIRECPMEIKEDELPSADLDVDVASFVDICCSVLNIPVYNSRVESLHCMFNLYMELKNDPQRQG